MRLWSSRARRLDSAEQQEQQQQQRHHRHHQEQHVGLCDLTDYEAAVEDTFLIKSSASSSSSSHERRKPFLWATEVRKEDKDRHSLLCSVFFLLSPTVALMALSFHTRMKFYKLLLLTMSIEREKNSLSSFL